MIQEYIPPSLANDLAVKFPGVANGKHVIDEDYPPAKVRYDLLLPAVLYYQRSRSESEPNEDYSKQITQKQIPVKVSTLPV